MSGNRTSMYLDHAATTTMRPEAKDAMAAVMETSDGNASGIHAAARAAKNAMESARERAAAIIGAGRPLDIVFTSGGTESDNLAIQGGALASSGKSIVVSEIEHHAVLHAAAAMERFGYTVAGVPCDGSAVVHAESVARAVGPDTAVVSIMAANNEIGTIQPIAEIAAVVADIAPGAVFHTDAVQAFVSDTIDVGSLGVDLLSLSAHKFGGPKGVGLLYVAPGTPIDPILHGGNQEAGLRSGTYNVAGIVGMVAAMEAAEATRAAFGDVRTERAAFEQRLAERIPGVVFNGSAANRMAQTSHVWFPGVFAETLLIRLDQEGIAAAAGSACQSGAVEPSHVLTAMGMSDAQLGECVRFAFGWDVTPGGGGRAADAVADVADSL